MPHKLPADLRKAITAAPAARAIWEDITPLARIQKLVRFGVRQNNAKAKKGTPTVCSRGHTFLKSSERPVCPTCWPGRYKQRRK